MAKRAKYPWETKKLTYTEWGRMDFDWNNHYTVTRTIPSYFFRYDNYLKGLKNEFVLKSTFGRKTQIEIIEEIQWWFDQCLGAYTQIEYE